MAGWINRNFHFEKEELTCVMEILIRLDGVRTMSIPPMMAAVQAGDVFTSVLELLSH
jgi:hypothetical protein